MEWTGIIDIHAHMGFIRGREYTVRETRDRMDKNGIERSVVLHFMSGLVDRDDFIKANDYVKSAVDNHPERFIGMCVVTPVHGSFAIEEIERCIEKGFTGLKFHPGKHGPYSLRNPIVDQIMRRVEASGMVVFIHSDFNSPFSNPYEVAALAAKFPNVKIILGHMGLDPDHYHMVPDIVKQIPNIYLDTSQTPDNPEWVFVSPIQKIGRERVLFGSDSHIISPEVGIKKLKVAVEMFGLGESDARAIMRENAISLLKGAPNANLTH